MSALVDKIYTLSDLIVFDESGLSIASFVDIKKTLINRMRQLYGIDIDVTDGSADGEWITEISLFINSLLQAVNNLYCNLNPATAQGKALDLLASFSNISRKMATASICEVTLTNNSAFDLPANARFIDKDGNEWKIDESRSDYLPQLINDKYSYSITSMSTGVVVPLIAIETGAIAIPANSIVGFLNVDALNCNVLVTQNTAGVTGTIDESDAHLRARRNQSGANESITVIDGIQGSLLENTNIEDVFIINHTDAVAAPSNIPAHSVEVIIRSKIPSSSSDNLKSFIANTIYNHLTPGIPAVYDAATTDTDKNTLYTFVESINNSQFFNKVVQWVEANPLSPKIHLTLHMLANCDVKTSAASVIKAIAKYANELTLLTDLNASDILQTAIFADPKYQSRSTFYCTPSDIELNDAATPFIYKPSEATDATDISAQVMKTFYKYDNTCNEVSATKYQNYDGTIIIEFA